MKKVNFFNIILTLICTLSLAKCGGDGCKYPDEIALGGLWEEAQTLTVRPIDTSVIAKENSYGVYTLRDGATEEKAMSNLWQPLLMRNGEYAVVEAGKKIKLIIDGAVTLAGYSQFINATLNKWISTKGSARYLPKIQATTEDVKKVRKDKIPTISNRDDMHLHFRQGMSGEDGIIPVQWADFKVKPGDELPITVSVANFGLSPAMVKTNGCTSGDCYANLTGGHGLMLYLFPDLPDVKKEGLYTDPEQWQCNMGLAGSYAFYMPYQFNDSDFPSGGFFNLMGRMIGVNIFESAPKNPRQIDNPYKHDYVSLWVKLGTQIVACAMAESAGACFVGAIIYEGLAALMSSLKQFTHWYCEKNYVQMWFSGYDFKGIKGADKVGVPEMHHYTMRDVNFFLPDFQYSFDGNSRLTNQAVDCASDHIPNKIYFAGGGSIDKYANNISLVEDYSSKKYQYTDNNGSTTTINTDDSTITSKIYPQAAPRELTVHLPAQMKDVKVTKDGNNLRRTTTDNKTFYYEFDMEGAHKQINVNSSDIKGASCFTVEELLKQNTSAGSTDPYFSNVSASDCDDYCVTNDNGETIFTRYGPFAGFHTSTSETVLPAIFESYGMCRGGNYMAAEDGDLGKLFIYDQQPAPNQLETLKDIATLGASHALDNKTKRPPLEYYWRVEFTTPSAEKNSDELAGTETSPPDERPADRQVLSSCYIKDSSECGMDTVPSSMIVNLKNTIGWQSGVDPDITVFLTRDANSIIGISNFEYTIQCKATSSDCISEFGSAQFVLDSNDPRIVEDGELCGGIPNCGPTEKPSSIEMILSTGTKFTLVFSASSGSGVVENAVHLADKKSNHYYQFTYNNKLYTIKQNMVSDYYKNCLEDTLRCSSWLYHYLNSGKTWIYKAFPLNTTDPECFEQGAIGSLGRAPYVIACAHGHEDGRPFYNGGYSGVGDQYKYAYMPIYDPSRRYTPSSFTAGNGKCEKKGMHNYDKDEHDKYYGGTDADDYENSPFMREIKKVNEQIGYEFDEKEFVGFDGHGDGKYDVQSALVLKSNIASYLKDLNFARCTSDWKTPGWMLLNNSGDISSINGEDSAISGSYFQKPYGPTLSESQLDSDYNIKNVHAKYGGMVLNTIYGSTCSDISLQASPSNPYLDAGKIKNCSMGSVTTFTPNFTTIYDKQIILVKNVINDPINASEHECTVSAGRIGGSVDIKMNEPFGDIIDAATLKKFWVAKTFDWKVTDLGTPGEVTYTDSSGNEITTTIENTEYPSELELIDGNNYGVSRYGTVNGDVKYRNSVFKVTEAARNLVGAGIIHATWHPLKDGSGVKVFNKGNSIALTLGGGPYNTMNALTHHSRAYCFDESTFKHVMQNIITVLFGAVLGPVLNALLNELMDNDDEWEDPGAMNYLDNRENYSKRNCGAGLAFRVVPIPEFACLDGYEIRCSNQRINTSFSTNPSEIPSHCTGEMQSVSWTDGQLKVGKCTKVEYDIATKQPVLIAGTTTQSETPQKYDSNYPSFRINTLIDGPTGGSGFSDQENILEGQCGICVKRDTVSIYDAVTYTTDELMVPMPDSVRSEENCNSFEDNEGNRYVFVKDVAMVTPLSKYSVTEYDTVVDQITNSYNNALGFCRSNYANLTTYTFTPDTTTHVMKEKIKNAFNKIAVRNKSSCIAIVEQIYATFVGESASEKTVQDSGSKTTAINWTLDNENEERKQCREHLDTEIAKSAEDACKAILNIIETKDGKKYYRYSFKQNSMSAVCKDNPKEEARNVHASTNGYRTVRDLTSDSLEKDGYVQLTKDGEIYSAEDAVTYNVKIPDNIKGRSFTNANIGFAFAGDDTASVMRMYQNFKIDSKNDLVRGYTINIGGSTPITKGKYLYLYFQPLTSSGKPDPNYNPNTYYSTTMANPITHHKYTPDEILADKDIYHFKDFDEDDDGIALFTAPASGKIWFAILDIPEIDPATGLNTTPEKDGKGIVFKADDPLQIVNGDNYLGSNSGHYIVSGKIMVDDTDFVSALLKSKYETGSTILTETLFNKLIIRPLKTIFFGWDKKEKKYKWENGFLNQLLKQIYSWPLLHMVYYIIVVFSVVIFGAKIMLGMESIDVKSIMSKFLKYALIAGFLNPSWMGLYTHWFVEGSFNLADGLSAYVAGNFTGSTYTESDAGNFIKIAFGPVDTIFRFWFKIETIERFLAILFSSWTGWLSAILLLLCLVHFVISVLEVLLIYIAIMFRMFIHLMIGPFFFIFLAFKSTENRWTKWWQELAGMISEQVCIFTALSVFCTIYYHVLKGALGFAYCWEPVLKIPVLNITLLSMWKIAGQLPTHMAELMGDFWPQGSGYSANQGFSILTGLCLFLLTNVMGKFVDKASKFGAGLFDGIGSGEAFGIQQFVQGIRQGINKAPSTIAKKIIEDPSKKK